MQNLNFNHNWAFWKLTESHAISHQAKAETERTTSERTLISMTDAILGASAVPGAPTHAYELEPPGPVNGNEAKRDVA